ncbi:hypothetical protein TGDOM2_285140, partial [Toxoplasma gondii GAB2-2007-GAL-DOM2]
MAAFSAVPRLNLFWLQRSGGSSPSAAASSMNPEEKKADVYRSLFYNEGEETIRLETFLRTKQHTVGARSTSESHFDQTELQSEPKKQLCERLVGVKSVTTVRTQPEVTTVGDEAGRKESTSRLPGQKPAAPRERESLRTSQRNIDREVLEGPDLSVYHGLSDNSVSEYRFGSKLSPPHAVRPYHYEMLDIPSIRRVELPGAQVRMPMAKELVRDWGSVVQQQTTSDSSSDTPATRSRSAEALCVFSTPCTADSDQRMKGAITHSHIIRRGTAPAKREKPLKSTFIWGTTVEDRNHPISPDPFSRLQGCGQTLQDELPSARTRPGWAALDSRLKNKDPQISAGDEAAKVEHTSAEPCLGTVPSFCRLVRSHDLLEAGAQVRVLGPTTDPETETASQLQTTELATLTTVDLSLSEMSRSGRVVPREMVEDDGQFGLSVSMREACAAASGKNINFEIKTTAPYKGTSLFKAGARRKSSDGSCPPPIESIDRSTDVATDHSGRRFDTPTIPKSCLRPEQITALERKQPPAESDGCTPPAVSHIQEITPADSPSRQEYSQTARRQRQQPPTPGTRHPQSGARAHIADGAGQHSEKDVHLPMEKEQAQARRLTDVRVEPSVEPQQTTGDARKEPDVCETVERAEESGGAESGREEAVVFGPMTEAEAQ